MLNSRSSPLNWDFRSLDTVMHEHFCNRVYCYYQSIPCLILLVFAVSVNIQFARSCISVYQAIGLFETNICGSCLQYRPPAFCCQLFSCQWSNSTTLLTTGFFCVHPFFSSKTENIFYSVVLERAQVLTSIRLGISGIQTRESGGFIVSVSEKRLHLLQ